MKQKLLGMVLLVLACGSANAALQSRLSGQAYYDTVLNITWLANANAGAGSIYDNGPLTTDGKMTWDPAQAWITSLNTANHLGVNDWRLPTTLQPDANCDGQLFPGDGFPLQGQGNGCTGSEMPHLYNVDGITSSTPSPFSNVQGNDYWSGTTYVTDTDAVWVVDFGSGYQNLHTKDGPYNYAWAVRPGDIDADNDGIAEAGDNCSAVANVSQCDSDGDGYGNRCDGDLNQSGGVNAFDTPLYRAQLGQPSVGPIYNEADLNCSGAVNAFDTPIFRGLLGSPPGPSGLVP